MCFSEEVHISKSTSETSGVSLGTNLVICHTLGKDRIVITENGTIP